MFQKVFYWIDCVVSAQIKKVRMSKVDLSVIVPCYNSNLEWLVDCLESVAEALSAFEGTAEVVVVDDGSEIGIESRLRLSMISGNFENFCIVSKSNGGLSSARNFGLEISKGTWCHFIDDDDKILPRFYGEMIGVAEKEEVDLVFCESNFFGAKDGSFEIPRAKVKKRLIIGNMVHVNGVVVRRELLENVGRFDESLNGLEDWDMWLRCIRGGGKVYVIHRNLAQVRIRPFSMSTNRPRMNSRMIELSLREWRDHFDFWSDNSDLSSGIVRDWALAGLSYALRSEAPLINVLHFYRLMKGRVGIVNSSKWFLRQSIKHIFKPEKSAHSFR